MHRGNQFSRSSQEKGSPPHHQFLRIFIWASTRIDWLFASKYDMLSKKMNGLYRILSHELSLSSGNAPELNYIHDPICMISAIFSYNPFKKVILYLKLKREKKVAVCNEKCNRGAHFFQSSLNRQLTCYLLAVRRSEQQLTLDVPISQTNDQSPQCESLHTSESSESGTANAIPPKMKRTEVVLAQNSVEDRNDVDRESHCAFTTNKGKEQRAQKRSKTYSS